MTRSSDGLKNSAKDFFHRLLIQTNRWHVVAYANVVSISTKRFKTITCKKKAFIHGVINHLMQKSRAMTYGCTVDKRLEPAMHVKGGGS